MIARSTKILPALVTGLAGVPGYNFFHYLKKRHPNSVYGIRPSHQPGLQFPGVRPFDAENPRGLETFIKTAGIRTLIDASGCCALKSCEYNPTMAEVVNVEQGVRYAEISRELGLRLIRLSTDMVFSGREEGLYRESDPISPITVYGSSMARAEELILQTCPDASIVRIPLPMAPSFSGHAGAIDWIRHRFHKGLPATLYYDEVRSSFYMQDLIRTLLWMCGRPLSGIYHFGGNRPLSLFQTAQIINRLGGYAPELLKGCPRREAGPIPPRIGNVSLDCSKLATQLTGIPMTAPLDDSGPSAGLRKIPADFTGLWPRRDRFVPTHGEWHYERDEKDGSIESDLYGYTGGVIEHPLEWLPGLVYQA